MKIVKAKEMARIERLAYEQGASEERFMAQAAVGVAELVQKIVTQHRLKPKIMLLCGAGNNAGDAYVAGKLLHAQGFEVRALALAPFEKNSSLNQLQSKQFVTSGGIIEWVTIEDQITFHDSELLIDGLLGTGFHGEVQGLFKSVIEKANRSELPIIAIDIPSGINGTTGEIGDSAIIAQATLFLGLPKIGCFYQDSWNYVGKIFTHNFGLEQQWIDLAETEAYLIDKSLIQSLFPKMKRTRHKYEAGYVVGIGGSQGMPGAPIMASFSALRAGAGIVRLLHPEGMGSELASAPYEVIRQSYKEGDIETLLEVSKRASALFIGPGMGLSSAALEMLQKLLPHLDKPCILDAEALTLISEQEIILPKLTLMTPHQGEMKRLLHIQGNISFRELLEKSAAYAREKQITLLLKGPPTYIFHPDSKPYILAHGDPGMATAGSGDVLTGILAAFLAQTQDPLKAAILGSYFHAVAGEHAAEIWSSSSMVATDITAALPKVFKSFTTMKFS